VVRTYILLPVALLAACASEPTALPEPTTEVALTPGRYSISMSPMVKLIGQMHGQGAALPTSICLTEADVAREPEALMAMVWDIGSSCDTYDSERKLNDFSGRVSCTFSNKDGSGTLQLIYEGKLTAEKVTGKAYPKVEATKFEESSGGASGEPDFAEMNEPFSFERQGDCTP
jgi:hypothetical protein